jgi:RND family efflux transporter MFP subunit
MNKFLIPLVLIAASWMVSCGGKTEKENQQAGILVKLGGIAPGTNPGNLSASGRIEAVNSANLSTRMMGYVTQLHVKAGQRVNAGTLLVSINSADLSAKKAQVEAAVMQATAAYNNAKKDYERFVNLFKQESASQKELDDMTARYEMAKAGLAGAREMRNEVIAQFAYADIKAPFAGVVTNTFVKEGDMANPGMPLVSVEGASRLQVSAMVAESDIAAIKQGMKVNVLVKSVDKALKGTVSELSASAKNTGGQYLVKIDLTTTDAEVLSGMFANVTFPVDKPATQTTAKGARVLVPLSALVKQGQLTGIYTVGSGDVAILRWLRLGKTFGENVEVLSGLSADEQYIVSAEAKLFNGAKVQLVN